MYQELLHIKVDNSPRSDELHLDVAWNGAFLGEIGYAVIVLTRTQKAEE